ncbi:MAG: copper resistance protein B [Persicimonas sp.]
MSLAIIFLILGLTPAAPLLAQNPSGQEAEDDEGGDEDKDEDEGPALPEGMTLDEALDRAEETPPDDYPDPVSDDRVFAFLLGEQLEYRLDPTDDPDQLGWELQGWFGGDFNKLWWKHEGEAVHESPSGLESETDLLYARLITPFWYAQIGAQYANEWATSAGDYEDRWSAVLAVQGMAPGMFEIDASVYLSQDAANTSAVNAPAHTGPVVPARRTAFSSLTSQAKGLFSMRTSVFSPIPDQPRRKPYILWTRYR